MAQDIHLGSNGKNDPESIILDRRKNIIEAVHAILLNVGEDPNREGLLDTPVRVAKAYEELLEGYSQDIVEIVNGALFDVTYGDKEIILVEGIEYSSMCEHHMLPFTGKAHVAYIPSEKIIGLSKIPRIVDMYAKRLQVQERLTNQIADAVDNILKPKGVFVLVEGEHSCASLRGVKKHHANMKTSSIRGTFKNYQERTEFYAMLSR